MIADGEFQALGELRYQIRRFCKQGDVEAKQAGLEA